MEFFAARESDTLAFGARLARVIGPGWLVFLRGPLGAGKTTLVRGCLRALGHRAAVRSPTYTLVESYDLGALRLHHFDLYRLAAPEELEYLGIRDYLTADSACVVEWPERAGGLLRAPDLDVAIDYEGAGRRIAVTAGSDAGRTGLARLQ